jgi:hypothetical protein
MIHSDNNVIDHAAHGRLGAGAKSPEGLAASARNSTKHGLSARNFCLLSNEDPKLFAQHQANLMAAFAPRNPIELDLVEKIIEAKWLMNRLTEIENRTLSMEITLQRQQRMGKVEPPADYALREATLCFFAMEELEKTNKTFANLARYRATHERSYYRAWNALAKMRGGPKALAAVTWPENPMESVKTEPTQFQELPMESPKLQNEAPRVEPNSEICETKPPEPTENASGDIPLTTADFSPTHQPPLEPPPTSTAPSQP